MEERVPNWQLVPEHLHYSLCLYIERGCRPGHFLEAVLSNDLIRSAQLADEKNHAKLADLADFLKAHAPSSCYGSSENVQAWLEQGGIEGRTAPTPAKEFLRNWVRELDYPPSP